MKNVITHIEFRLGIAFLILAAAAGSISAQVTSFTYQGKLSDNGAAANGTYDIEFRLFDSAAGGLALGTQQKLNVPVADGVFAVQLDFGSDSFNGAPRYIEIAVKPAGAGSFTTMSPRSAIGATPYAIRSKTADTAINTWQLGGVDAGNFVQTTDPRMNDARPPAAGSASYIQNTNTAQAGTNFNISGNGTLGGQLNAARVNTNTGFYISDHLVVSIRGAGSTLIGVNAGFDNAGQENTFIGLEAGKYNQFGGYNTFLGIATGETNLSGSRNTLLGYHADVEANGLSNATAIGSYATVSQNNSLILGSINGLNGATADTNVGIGTTTPRARLHVATSGGNMLFGDPGCSPGFVGIGFGDMMTGCQNYSLIGDGTDTIVNRPFGGRIIFRENNATQMTIAAGGIVSINTLGSGGATQLCRNASNQISTCSSSLRYKTDLHQFTRGLSLLDQLNPITFRWKADNMLDLGFGAEDVAKVEPLLATYNDKGEVEGVKYDRITAVLVNAVKEQQAQIAELQRKVEVLSQRLKTRRYRAPGSNSRRKS